MPRPLLAAALGLLFSLTTIVARAGDWPQFLGPNRNGVATETGLIDEFPSTGPKVVWRMPGGVGMSGLAIVGDTVCTLVQKEGQQFVVALNTANGKTRWQTAIASAYENSMGDGPRATPCIADGQVFVYTGEGMLAALDLKSGEVLWQHHPVQDLGGQPAEYGMACSPLVAGAQVVVIVGAPQATVAAYDRKSGKLAWKSGQEDTAGYSSPALFPLNGKPQLVVYNGKAATGIEPQGGKLLWRFPYETDYDCNIATPLAVDQGVLISSGENHGSTLLKISPAGQVTEQWTSQGTASVLRNEWQTSILIDGYLYGFDNSGSAGPITNFTCVQAATGKQQWLQRRFGKGNLIAADGKLWLTTMAGELVLIQPSPEKFQEVSRAQVMQTTRQAPAIANGHLYVRDGADVICFDLRK